MTGQPMARRTFLSVALASAGGMALSACGFSGDDGDGEPASGDATDGAGSGGTATLRQIMSPVAHLDPAMTGSSSARGNLLQTGLMEGLVLRNPDDTSTVLPGVAESWEISDDGLVYTFFLRGDATWSNGDPVTAGDFVWNWERLLSPATTADIEYNTSANADIKTVEGAAAFAGGTETDFSTVGVKATDDATLEIRLTAPNPLFLYVLSEWRTLPLNPTMVEENPGGWLDPEIFVGNGPYVLSSWQANTGATLTRSDTYWDADSYPVQTWETTFNDGGDTAAIVRYSADETGLFMVEGDPGAILADDSVADQLVTGPPSQFKCLLALTSKNPLLEDVNIRRAFSLAIDREAVAEVAAPDVASGRLVPQGIPGYDQIPETTMDLDQAKQLLADAGYPDGQGMPTINLLVAQQTPWLEAIGGMWQENLGVTAKVDVVEQGVFRERRTAVQSADYVGFCFGYFGLTPPTLYKSCTWAVQGLTSFALPGAAAAQYQATLADTTMQPADQTAALQAIIDAEAFPEYKAFLDLVEQATAAANDAEELERLCIEALTTREQAYLAIPVLSAGYTFMVKPSIQNLNITSYPDRVFSMRDVDVTA